MHLSSAPEPAVALNTSTESSEKTRSRVVYEVLVEVSRSVLRPEAVRSQALEVRAALERSGLDLAELGDDVEGVLPALF